MNHSFDVEIAKEYGIQPAILLNHIYFWIEKNKANNKHYYDGYYWTYNSKKAFSELFPYMTERQIDYALTKLVNAGLIIKGNYNKNVYDRTLWYAITKVGYSTLQNCKIEQPKLSNEPNKIVQPIPDINPNTNTDINKEKCKNKQGNSEWEHEQVKEKLKAIDNMDVKTRLASLMKYRLAKNKPVTIEVLNLILDKLERYSGGDDKKKIAILERSIEKGYDTVYELVQKQNIKLNKWGIYEDEHEASYNIEGEENYCLSNEYDDDLAYWTEQLGE